MAELVNVATFIVMLIIMYFVIKIYLVVKEGCEQIIIFPVQGLEMTEKKEKQRAFPVQAVQMEEERRACQVQADQMEDERRAFPVQENQIEEERRAFPVQANQIEERRAFPVQAHQMEEGQRAFLVQAVQMKKEQRARHGEAHLSHAVQRSRKTINLRAAGNRARPQEHDERPS